MTPAWLVLMISLPPHPSSLRVRAWRKLRALGAVALKKSVYLLPFTPEHVEHFQWLSQEVQKDGGEATLLKVDQIENMARADVIRIFHEARNQDYRALVEQYRKVARGPSRKGHVARQQDALTRLTRDLQRIREIDFFDAPGYEDVKRPRETLEMRLQPPHAPAAPPPRVSLDSLKGRRWVTRPRPHIDRIGAAWPRPRFLGPDPGNPLAPAGGLSAHAPP